MIKFKQIVGLNNRVTWRVTWFHCVLPFTFEILYCCWYSFSLNQWAIRLLFFQSFFEALLRSYEVVFIHIMKKTLLFLTRDGPLTLPHWTVIWFHFGQCLVLHTRNRPCRRPNGRTMLGFTMWVCEMDYPLTEEHWEQAIQTKGIEQSKRRCTTQSNTPRQLHKTNTKYSRKTEIIFHYTTKNGETDMLQGIF